VSEFSPRDVNFIFGIGRKVSGAFLFIRRSLARRWASRGCYGEWTKDENIVHKYIRIYLYSIGAIVKRKAKQPVEIFENKISTTPPFSGLKNPPHQIPRSKTLILSTVHKYIRIYLYG